MSEAAAQPIRRAHTVQPVTACGEPEVVHGDGLEGAQLQAAVAAVGDGDAMPGQAGAAVAQRGLVGLDDQQGLGLLAVHQKLGGTRVDVQRISGDHHTGQVGQQRPETGNLARRTVDVSLGQHGASGVVHTGQQVDLPALGAAGAA